LGSAATSFTVAVIQSIILLEGLPRIYVALKITVSRQNTLATEWKFQANFPITGQKFRKIFLCPVL
jgi:hypothetical protein